MTDGAYDMVHPAAWDAEKARLPEGACVLVGVIRRGRMERRANGVVTDAPMREGVFRPIRFEV